MPTTFRPYHPKQKLLLPPDLRDREKGTVTFSKALALYLRNGVKRLNMRDIDHCACLGKIVAHLHIHPVMRRCLEGFRQSECSIRCYRRLAFYDAFYTRSWHAQFLCQGPGAHLERLKVQLVQDFTRMHRYKGYQPFPSVLMRRRGQSPSLLCPLLCWSGYASTPSRPGRSECDSRITMCTSRPRAVRRRRSRSMEYSRKLPRSRRDTSG